MKAKKTQEIEKKIKTRAEKIAENEQILQDLLNKKNNIETQIRRLSARIQNLKETPENVPKKEEEKYDKVGTEATSSSD